VKESSLGIEKKKTNYYRANLSLAIRELRKFIDEIKNQDNNIILFKEHLLSYIFDIKPFIEFFERKQNNDFILFAGERNYYTTSQEIKLASNSLFWQSPQNSIFDQKISFNLAVFTLRQSLELKFRRICGILEIHYNKHLKHDFFIDFIKQNRIYFDFPENCSLTHIFKIYSWTNLTIHSGNRPRIWEIQFALEFTQILFSGGTHKKDNKVISSVFGAVKIKEFNKMKQKLTQTISEYFKNGTDINIIWLDKPEAIIESF
jgi:hypothetical protein